MTFQELMEKVRENFPHAEIGEDADGQIVIHTGLQETAEGNVEVMPEIPADLDV